jgi:hypothetical protein
MDVARLRLSAMRALWGIATPNLREVSIQEKDDVITLYFYYDQEPSEEEIDLSEDAATEVIANFSEPFLIACERKVARYPEKINFEGYLIYSRFEK